MGHSIYENDHYSTFSKKTNKIRRDNTKHYPNKDEASLLRKIISETGLSEKKIREVKKYRIMLSDAQKQAQKPKHNSIEKWYQKRIKEACKKTGLVPQHPKTIKVLDEILTDRYGCCWRWKPVGINRNKMTAKTVVRDYAK